MKHLPESTQLLYAQLLSQYLHSAAPNGRGLSFVHKTLKGARHWYLQLTVGSHKSQHYLGPDSEAIQTLAICRRSRQACSLSGNFPSGLRPCPMVRWPPVSQFFHIHPDNPQPRLIR